MEKNLTQIWRVVPGALDIHARNLLYRTPSEVISLHLGYPDPSTFPLEQMQKVLTQTVLNEGSASLQYCPEKGDANLRRWLADSYRGVRSYFTEENIVVTQGTTETLNLIADLFVSKGDCVVMENPTYLWAIRTLRLRQANLVGVMTDDEGVIPEHLRSILRQRVSSHQRPKYIYLMPDFQNPSGHSMSMARRIDVLRIAQEFETPIVEDSAYLELRYDGDPLPTLFDLDNNGLVIQARSFSKTIAPGVRLGWLSGEKSIIDDIAAVKQTGACAVVSRALARYIQTSAYAESVGRAREVYRRKRNAMRTALSECLAENVQWTSPAGGFYFWVRFPDWMDIGQFCEKASACGVMILKGDDFCCDRSVSHAIRLSFSYEAEERMVRGVAVLGDLLRDSCRTRSIASPITRAIRSS